MTEGPSTIGEMDRALIKFLLPLFHNGGGTTELAGVDVGSATFVQPSRTHNAS